VIVDRGLAGSVRHLWRGYRFALLDDGGGGLEVFETMVVDSNPEDGTLRLAESLPAMAVGQRYLLSTGEHAPVVAIRFLLGIPGDESIGQVDVRLGTTRGTNALLTRTGARVGLLTTRGLADGLEIAYQDRPRLFELNIRKPGRLYEVACEVDERLAADGSILTGMDEQQLQRDLHNLRATGVESLAICFLHSYINPIHELRAQELAVEAGFAQVSVSHQIAQTLGWIARSDTTVVDAYLSPVLSDYLNEIRQSLGEGSRLQMLTSAGDLVGAARFRGKDSVLSGPAGGVVGFAFAAETAGFETAIGFDMGGTSTDVSRYDGFFDRQFETEKAGVRIVSPMMSIETVAAGGGSICGFDGVKLTVGPSSAGADPGPACYGRGGPLTVTDVNLLLGKLQASRLPFELDRSAAEQRIDELRQLVERGGHNYDRRQLAEGLLQIANNNIVQAIRSVSVAKGVDPSSYVLAAFGGAAGQHSCAVAEALGIQKVLLHPDAGVLSAWGIGAARAAQHTQRAVYEPLSQCGENLADWIDQLGQQAVAQLRADQERELETTQQCWLDLRYLGTQATLALAWTAADAHLEDEFHDTHSRRYGYRRKLPVEVVRLRVEASEQTESRRVTSRDVAGTIVTPDEQVEVFFRGEEHATSVIHRDELATGDIVDGPALITEPHTTIVIDPGWRARRLSQGELLVEPPDGDDKSSRHTPSAVRLKSANRHGKVDIADPIYLEILHNHFAAIADQMGIALRDTSVSVNVKERLDFSCALFTSRGDLIANAPHVPVHLGAMSETVKAIDASFPEMKPGDAFISNDPYRGGSHLPDITVVSPVFLAADPRPAFFVANRAHHAEIGGIVPGSMPPNSTTLDEEGVLLSNLRLAQGGVPDWDLIEQRLSTARFPSRNVADNLADIAAQLSANHRGIAGLEDMVAQYSDQIVRRYAQFVLDASATKMRRALRRIEPGVREFRDTLDNGALVQVCVEFQGEMVTLDFSGSSPVLTGNLNANRAITTAAVMYCMRLFLDEDVPLNQGVLEPVEIKLPPCFLNPAPHSDPALSPAVAGGNVETSQRVVDVVLGAFGLAAASQGTMNNLTFGNERFGYYETIGGGEGATACGNGASAVHTHMTNTRLTDPEVFECRLPVRLWKFAIRHGSGGGGEFRGGDGLIREIEFLEPLDVALLTNRRFTNVPYGMAGGDAGLSGENLLIDRSGERLLPAVVQVKVTPGDRLRISTPGGGGWGDKVPSSKFQVPG
jgi:5-oxoprolinase (ATP-hydrolysing)